MKEKVYCKCGCGREVKKGNKYIHGHRQAELTRYKSSNRWSMWYSCCVSCGTTKIKYRAYGMCINCYTKKRYRDKKTGRFIKWSKKYDKCIDCGKTDMPHQSNGRCSTCAQRHRDRLNGVPKKDLSAWSWYHDKCIKCGTTERPHAAKGLCKDCYEESKRSGNLAPCPVCGVKVIGLNQHISMRAIKDEAHRKYQYNLLKKYFDSDFSIKDIAKELEMDKGIVTVNFKTHFGIENTKKRNTSVARCVLSERSIKNDSYKNMYGTVVEYESPLQGTIKLRSKLEEKYAKQLDEKSIKWLYESRAFPYLDEDNIRHTYTPDFYIIDEDKYVEVKSTTSLPNENLYKVHWIRKNANINIEVVRL